jgi:bile acid:Na+ symporter, BASS family
MDSSQIAQLLTAAVAVIMFGLGLSLRLADFARVLRFPRAVVVGLFVQTLVLVGVAYLITRLFALPPILAVGLMLLAASPGGAMANIFSHLARGDVALNITLTALNCVLALLWMPLIMNWSLEHFLGAGHYIPPPTRKIIEVGVVIIAPVIAGMCVRHLAPLLAGRAAKPVRVLSILVLVAVLVPSVIASGDLLREHLAAVGFACLAFNLTSLTLGYLAPRLAGLPVAQATAIAFEIGVHNAAIAIYIAAVVVDSQPASVPAAVYGILQVLTAPVFVIILRRRQAMPARAAA